MSFDKETGKPKHFQAGSLYFKGVPSEDTRLDLWFPDNQRTEECVSAYAETAVTLECVGHLFKARGKTVTDPGWRAYAASPDEEKAGDDAPPLPALSEAAVLPLAKVELKEGKTTPPQAVHGGRSPSEHEPIISCTNFEAVAKLMRRNMRCAGDSDRHDLFSGYLFCGDCEGAMIRKTQKAKGKAYVYYNCGNNKRTHECNPHSFSEAKLTEIVFHAIHDQIEVVLHLDKVLCFIDSLPQRNRKVFSYEAQMTRLEDEIQRYKKLELGLYENFVEGIINKAEYTDFRENYRGLIEEKQEAVKRLKREQQDAAAMGSQNRAWVQVFAQYENVQELDRRILLALVDKILIYEDKKVEIVFRYRDEFARAMEVAKNYKDCPLPAVG